MNNLYINGEWKSSGTGETLEVINPGTGKLYKEIPFGGGSDANEAIEAAHRAFYHWSNMTPNERSQCLRRASELIEEHVEELALIVTRETGKPITEARNETLRASENFLWYSEETKRINGETLPSNIPTKRLMVLKQPIGVVGAITPWNIPLNMIARKLGPALAAGCTVVLKPSENTPISSVKIFEIFEQVGFPKGVVNLVIGKPQEIGEEFINNEKVSKITFTGSTRVGKYLMEGASKQVKNISLELGGHAPFIVFEDADIDQAIDALFLTKFGNNGQMCISANRLYVHEDIVDEFTNKLVNRLSNTKVGIGEENDTDIGPLINEDALNKVLDHVNDAVSRGATVVYGGERINSDSLEEGFFCMPTVLTNVDNTMKVYKEETFGPVAPIITFTSDEEIVEKANDTKYGLAAYFFSKNTKRCFEVSEKLQFGMIGVNDGWPIQIHTPFPGHKESGIGVEGGYFAVDEFLLTKLVTFNIEN
ncbi:NAD-dependent succinate-semialdehyde dehydrogenase [Oceanobacillus damuensis]|uniref:NAD-dependent succinate-semialdehyde dehydrogenase n=1 Tax=Oceanobacillus damuensis TaxID=937928 RepID=UPI000833EDBF|nr:NAD-dependent succinate-semialdehyde dehydrogenase [Oceanobacillus damuensis]